MSRPAHIGLSVALLLCHPVAHAESTTNKCTDGKHITYANMPCEKLGLKSIGHVKAAVTVVPAIKKPKKELTENPGQERGEKNDGAEPEASGADATGTGKLKSVNPIIEKMMQ